MKKFKVWAKYSTYCFLYINAKTHEEAEDIAGQKNGRDFQQKKDNSMGFGGGWDIINTMTTEVE